MSTEGAREAVATVAMQAQGATVTLAERGIGSMITVELAHTDDTAGYRLWVYMADWRLQGPAGAVCGSADDAGHIDAAIGELHGATLHTIMVDPSSNDTAFVFDGGQRLWVFGAATDDDDDEYWMLFPPDGTVLAIGPGTRWDLNAADAPHGAGP